MVLTFYALRTLPLPLATALTFLAPLFATVGAIVFLGEHPSPRVVLAAAVGFLGIMLLLAVAEDDAHYPDIETLGIASGLGGAILMAASMLQLKRLSSTESAAMLTFYFSIAATFVGLAFLPFDWPKLSQTDIAMGAVAGFLGAGSQLANAQSLRLAPISKVAPVDYLLLVWTLLINAFYFNRPTPTATLVGATVIIAAAIIVRGPILSKTNKTQRQ